MLTPFTVVQTIACREGVVQALCISEVEFVVSCFHRCCQSVKEIVLESNSNKKKKK